MDDTAEDRKIPSRVITICPALILAASRNERVIGRTRVLMVSIRTKKGLSQSGAPPGRSLAINVLGEFVKDDIIKDSQKGSPRDRVMIKCLEALKI